jgi:hypothetical protein
MQSARPIRVALRAIAIVVLAFSILTDPTMVGRNKRTYFETFFVNLGISAKTSNSIAYFVNQYTLASLAIWFIASLLKSRTPNDQSGKTLKDAHKRVIKSDSNYVRCSLCGFEQWAEYSTCQKCGAKFT